MHMDLRKGVPRGKQRTAQLYGGAGKGVVVNTRAARALVVAFIKQNSGYK